MNSPRTLSVTLSELELLCLRQLKKAPAFAHLNRAYVEALEGQTPNWRLERTLPDISAEMLLEADKVLESLLRRYSLVS